MAPFSPPGPSAMPPAPAQYQPSRQATALSQQQNQYGPPGGDSGQQRRYPPPQPYGPDGLVQQMGQLNVTQMGYNKLWVSMNRFSTRTHIVKFKAESGMSSKFSLTGVDFTVAG